MTLQKQKWPIIAALLALAGGAYLLWGSKAGDSAQKYKTQQVDRGDIVSVISANGTLNPVVLVNVGTQVSGTIKKLHADFNSKVAAGQILAELDPALFEAQLRQSTANFANATANLNLARLKEKRARELLARGFISQTQMDEAEQALESAQAQLATARAQMERDRTNLNYSVIRSPVSGVVVARNVDVGQTVAASFQTPTLFMIAGDLKKMQIDTSVAEADIGNMLVGMPVNFSVDAFPEQQFAGQIRQIRLNPAIQQNVVTYNVVVAVDNPQEILLPGMTAHVRITTSQRQNVLRIPNAALRFKPAEGETKPVQPGTQAAYKLQDGKLAQVGISTGATDGNFTEVTGGDLKAGDAVVVKAQGQGGKKESGGFRFRHF